MVEYAPHPVHAGGAVFHETNCYTDVVVELLHSRGLEPLAVLGRFVRLDFEGDQWTFFKPDPEDLELLLGVDIHEMQPYRALPLQAAELLAAGRTMIVEADSFHLPDTEATSYRTEHVKSSIAVDAIDAEAETLTYFHNAGRYALSGEDYRGVFRTSGDWSADVLPPYTEIVRFDAAEPLAGAALRDGARARLLVHAARRPATNPFPRFGAQLEAVLPALLDGDLTAYHDYAFATVRMIGAGFELSAAMVDWCCGPGGEETSAAMRELVDASKRMSFRLARRKPFDVATPIGEMAASWDRAMGGLDALRH
ncbi:MAG: DUF1839 family protein [Baekduia sp.]